jgi:hypothetical protein
MRSLDELQERRAYELRLTPDRALRTLDEAEAFLHERGLLTRTADSALPSLYEACHEEAYKPGAGGFATWPRTKWPWFHELAARPGIHPFKVHSGKSILFTDETLALADAIFRAELERMEREDPAWARLLGHLADAGASTGEDLRVELELKPKELKLILSPLMRCGAVVRAVEDVQGEEYLRYDQAYPDPLDGGGLAELVVAGVWAAVVAPERELPRWFSWRRLFEPELFDRLVAEGRLERPAPGWVVAPESA